jgi:AbiV family abortive infection protein
MTVSTEFLLEGAAKALEQCGLLLSDANILYTKNSFATAVVLAAFAREELGRYTILLGFWRKAFNGQETYTKDKIIEACNDHVSKQRAGMLSTTVSADNQSGVGKLIQTRIRNKNSRRRLLRSIKSTKLRESEPRMIGMIFG